MNGFFRSAMNLQVCLSVIDKTMFCQVQWPFCQLLVDR